MVGKSIIILAFAKWKIESRELRMIETFSIL